MCYHRVKWYHYAYSESTVIFWHLARPICCSVLMYFMFRFLIEIEKLCLFKSLITIYVQSLVKIMQYNATKIEILFGLKEKDSITEQSKIVIIS